jgi:hypothetical protein
MQVRILPRAFDQMKRYAIHPLAKLMPHMTAEEYNALKTDIEQHGQREVIYLYEGKVIDGVHRLRACRELGFKPLVSDLVVKDPLAWVVSLNMKRRHLTVQQRAKLAVKLLPRLQQEAKERQREGGRAKGSATRRQAGKATAHAAKMVGVSTRSVERAKAFEERVRQRLKLEPYLAREEAWRKEAALDGQTVDGRRRRRWEKTGGTKSIIFVYEPDDILEMATWLRDLMKVTHTKTASAALMALKRELWPKLKRRMPARTRGHGGGHGTTTR